MTTIELPYDRNAKPALINDLLFSPGQEDEASWYMNELVNIVPDKNDDKVEIIFLDISKRIEFY